MRERLKTFAAFGVSLCGVCAFLVVPLALGWLDSEVPLFFKKFEKVRYLV